MIKNQIFAKTNSATTGEIRIYDDIGEGFFGGISAASFAEELKTVRDVSTLDVYINSGGGQVFDGVSIYNQLRAHKGKKIVHIDALAASIASIIALAGDEIEIASNALMMIHDPRGVAFGGSDDMRKTADLLDTIRSTMIDTYADRTGQPKDKIAAWCAAETWMTADQAVANGFATRKTTDKGVKAHLSPNIVASFKHMPDALKGERLTANVALSRMTMRTDKIRRERASGTA